MTRGISQGCPLPALLFLFVAEIHAIKIKKKYQNINGIAINNIKIKNIQHVDDLTVVLRTKCLYMYLLYMYVYEPRYL